MDQYNYSAEPKYSSEVAASQPSTLEQLGQAIKFIGTFMSWARAINPSTTTDNGYARSNAAFPESGALWTSGVEQQPQQQQQGQLRKGLIGEPRVDSGGYC